MKRPPGPRAVPFDQPLVGRAGTRVRGQRVVPSRLFTLPIHGSMPEHVPSRVRQPAMRVRVYRADELTEFLDQ